MDVERQNSKIRAPVGKVGLTWKWAKNGGLTLLRSLDLAGATGITSLEPLTGLTRLRSLDLAVPPPSRAWSPSRG
jgi:hypothetical protein